MDSAELGFGLFGENVFSWTNEQCPAIKPLPTSLDGALQALIEDHVFLLTGDVFSEERIENWIEYEREVEHYPVHNRPHP